MMNVIAMFFAFVLITGCNRQDHGSNHGFINSVESVDSRQVIHDGKPWIEVTISQQVNPKSPAYVVGVRESKSLNRLSWMLVEQKIETGRVTSRFRFRPVDEFAEMQLTRDDFEWYPTVSGFRPVTIHLTNAEQGTINR